MKPLELNTRYTTWSTLIIIAFFVAIGFGLVEVLVSPQVYTQAERNAIIKDKNLDTTDLPAPELCRSLTKNWARAFFLSCLAALVVCMSFPCEERINVGWCVRIFILVFGVTFFPILLLLNSVLDHPYIPFKPTSQQKQQWKLKKDVAYYTVRSDEGVSNEGNHNELGTAFVLMFLFAMLIMSAACILSDSKDSIWKHKAFTAPQ
jgi:hypothetical protein